MLDDQAVTVGQAAAPKGGARWPTAWRAGPDRAVSARVLGCLDLTKLAEGCDAAQVDALCARAAMPHGPVAAVCLWPRFVAQARRRLGPGDRIRIATVVNFPGEDGALPDVVAEARAAMAAGADEIDLVVPYRALMATAVAETGWSPPS